MGKQEGQLAKAADNILVDVVLSLGGMCLGLFFGRTKAGDGKVNKAMALSIDVELDRIQESMPQGFTQFKTVEVSL